MQKKNIVIAISAIGAVLSTGVNAQGALSPTDRVVIEQDKTRLTVPTQAANPMGSIPQSGGGGINYGGGGGGLNQQHITVPNNMVNQAIGYNSGMAANNVLQNQTYGGNMGLPSALPAGLPNSVNMPLIRRDKDEITPIERTMNILNTPDERINEIRKELYNKGKLLNQSALPPAKPVNSVVVASLSPGATSPVVRLTKGRTSAIIVTDSTGKPWPIMNFDGLSDENFVLNRLDGNAAEGYMLSVTPLGQFVSGNLVLVLKDLPSPLVIEFVTGQSEVDVKTEVRVQAVGPNAVFQALSMPESINPQLLSLLQGVAPSSAKALVTSTNDVQAWMSGEHMYVRTRYRVSSPAPIDITTSPDGTFAYKMMPAPVVLYSAGLGKTGSFSVSGF